MKSDGPKNRKGGFETYKRLYLLGTVGVNLVVSIVIGLLMGIYLDRWLDSAPWFMLLFLGFGVAAGFRNLYRIAVRELSEPYKEDDK